MTEPTGGVPNQGAPVPPPTPPTQGGYQAPPPAAPTPPPAQGGYQAPPPQGAPTYSTPTFQQAAVEAGPAPGIAYADLVTRIIALVIDSVILFVIYVLVGLVLNLFGWIGGLLAAVAYAAVSAGYFVYLWTKQRATYGQKFQKLECVNAADGATLTQDQAIRRWLFLFGPSQLVAILTNIPFLWVFGSLASLLVLVYYIYLLWTASQSSKRQGFHDVQAGTVVVKHL